MTPDNEALKLAKLQGEFAKMCVKHGWSASTHNMVALWDCFMDSIQTGRDQVLKELSEMEPVEIEYPEYHTQGMGCGLEDRDIRDRYEAMRYGWDCAIDSMAERIPDKLIPQPAMPKEE